MARKPGLMRDLVAFDPPLASEDGYGNTEDGFDTGSAVTRWAELIYRRGGEGVEAGSRTGNAIYKVKIRSSAATRAITTDWRMRDLGTGQSFDLIEVDALSDRAFVWIVAEGLTGVSQ